MEYKNPHSEYIDKRVSDYRKNNKWKTKIVDTTHEDFIKDFGTNLFTNFIKSTFTKTYMKKHNCSDCKKPSQERCHGIGDERLILIKKALEKKSTLIFLNPFLSKKFLFNFLLNINQPFLPLNVLLVIAMKKNNNL